VSWRRLGSPRQKQRDSRGQKQRDRGRSDGDDGSRSLITLLALIYLKSPLPMKMVERRNALKNDVMSSHGSQLYV
jgi:hypothetical protein